MVAENETYDKMEIFRTKIDQIKHLCNENAVPTEIIEKLNEFENLLFGESVLSQSEISAQFSIYPLRSLHIIPAIHQALTVLRSFNLSVVSGSMSTMVFGEDYRLWMGLEEVFSAVSNMGDVVMIITVSNACPKPEE